MQSFGIYFHYPYCRRICPYCDFNVYGVRGRADKQYFETLRHELRYYLQQPQWAGRSVCSVYFGGGTPSLAPPKELAGVLSLLRSVLESDAEITLEVNPEDITRSLAEEWRHIGITRVSVGAQGVQDRNIKLLGRRHTANQLFCAFEILDQFGPRNLSLDYIFGIPGQSSDSLRSDIALITDLPLQHVSAYELTLEKGTKFYQLSMEGKFQKPSEDELAEFYEIIIATLEDRAFEHYEVSNFALSGYFSKHNLIYWTYRDYLGIGAGAHSFHSFEGRRWSNLASPKDYMKAQIPTTAWFESIGADQQKYEFLLLGLRLREGVSLDEYRSRFGSDIRLDFKTAINEFQLRGLLFFSDERMYLNNVGRALLDEILGDPLWQIS